MNDKMTSGEIAKRAGVSPKAIRLYDEKGLLKPSEYTEGNYRLYDDDALLVLEKIIALKQIGFSLEEIHENLVAESDMDIAESLKHQLRIMEERKMQLEQTIGCIKGVLARANDQPDWDQVAELAQMIQKDQRADMRHFFAMNHETDGVDWYEKIYQTLNLQEGQCVLDLGCGYGKLWRNNWRKIPEKTMITAVDIHGGWADDFANWLNKEKGLEKHQVQFLWGDIRVQDTWNRISEHNDDSCTEERNVGKTYNLIIAHYLFGFIEDHNTLLSNIAAALSNGGVFSCNYRGLSKEYEYWAAVLQDIKLEADFAEKKLQDKKQQRQEFALQLHQHFARIETIEVENAMKYVDVEDIMTRICECYKEELRYIKKHEHVIKEYFGHKLELEGAIIVPTDNEFWHCYK